MLSEEAAVEVWVYPENNTAAAGIIHKGTEPDFSDESYSLQYNRAGEVAMIFTNEAGDHTYVIAPEPRLTENNWHHIVVEWNQTTVRLYIDGAETDLNYYQSGLEELTAVKLRADPRLRRRSHDRGATGRRVFLRGNHR